MLPEMPELCILDVFMYLFGAGLGCFWVFFGCFLVAFGVPLGKLGFVPGNLWRYFAKI